MIFITSITIDNSNILQHLNLVDAMKLYRLSLSYRLAADNQIKMVSPDSSTRSCLMSSYKSMQSFYWISSAFNLILLYWHYVFSFFFFTVMYQRQIQGLLSWYGSPKFLSVQQNLTQLNPDSKTAYLKIWFYVFNNKKKKELMNKLAKQSMLTDHSLKLIC